MWTRFLGRVINFGKASGYYITGLPLCPGYYDGHYVFARHSLNFHPSVIVMSDYVRPDYATAPGSPGVHVR